MSEPAPREAPAAPLQRAAGGPRAPFLAVALLVAALVAAGWATRGRIPLLANLEGQVIDLQHRLRGTLAPGDAHPLSILMVDDRSIKELGRLPISRAVLASAIERLREDGARLVVLDMLLADPTREQQLEDDQLAAAIRANGRVLLAFALLAQADPATEAEPPLEHAYLRYRHEQRRELMPFRPGGLLAPLAPFAHAALALGNVSVRPGHDGSLRFDLPALWFDGELYPTLALRAAAAALALDWASVEARLGESIELGETRVPLDVVSRQWVNYYGPEGGFPTHSFADYAAGRLDPALVRGRIVLLGGSALGSSDRYPSPFDPSLPGVERMATVIDNVLTGRWLSRPGWAAPVEIAGIVLLPFAAALLIRRLRPLHSLLVLSALGVGIAAAAQLVFALRREFVALAFPLAALVLAAGFGIALRAWIDERSRRLAEEQLRASELRYALSVQGANDGLWDWNIASGEAYFSPRLRELMGLAAEQPLRCLDDWTARLDQLERERFRSELEAHLKGLTRQFRHLFRYDREGEERWLLARGVAVREGATPIRMAGSITDLTEQKRLERQIAFDAIHDRLTGLPNKALLLDRLEQLLAAGEAGLYVIDLDGFIAVENRYGQLACDAILRDLASRLRALAEGGHIVAHLGGDQFALGYRGAEYPRLRAGVEQLLVEPFRFKGDEERLTATVGHAHSRQLLESAAELLGAATLAVASGKRHSRGALSEFDPASQEIERSQRWLRENIVAALAAGDQFELHYQPFVRLADRRLLGFEALIRWRHPERGMIMPGDFIPYAEQSGLINPIGRWSLHEVARQLVAWDRAGFDGEIAVNLSSRQFADTDLIADAAQVLGTLGSVAPMRFKFEVTESMSMANPQRTAELLERLAGMGFKISIDDFGTGYSSLAYLHRFPFHTLKIDRSFVIRLGAGREAQEIVRTICGLARTLGKQVLAEGVEDEAQARTLHELGTEVGQGWLFARALPAGQAERWFLGDPPERPSR